MLVAPLMTWLFVSTTPFDVSTMPVPAACSCWYPSVVLMSTRPGSTLAAMALTSLGPELFEPEFPLPELPELPELPRPPNPPPLLKGEEPERLGVWPPNVPDADWLGVRLFHAASPIPTPAARMATAAQPASTALRTLWSRPWVAGGVPQEGVLGSP